MMALVLREALEWLSRWTKVLLQITEPEIPRQDTGFALGFGWREHEHPQHRADCQDVDRRRLAVGRDHRLQRAPELIHRVQLRRLLRQPDEADIERGRQRLRLA